MKKIFCDVCGDEVTEKNHPHNDRMQVPVKTPSGRDLKWHVSVYLIPNEPADSMNIMPDICKYCVLHLIQRLDDRPRVRASTCV